MSWLTLGFSVEISLRYASLGNSSSVVFVLWCDVMETQTQKASFLCLHDYRKIYFSMKTVRLCK